MEWVSAVIELKRPRTFAAVSGEGAMMKTSVVVAVLVSLPWTLALAQSTATPAAAPASVETKRVKMRALLAAGYEIKSVVLVSQDVSSRVAQKPDKDAALVTLQKGSSAATCFLALDAYVSPGMLDIEWCIEQK